jgi:hypothetical protein
MDAEKIKRNIYAIKVITAIVFGIIIFFTLYKKPNLPEKIKDNYIEMNFKTYGGNLLEKGWNIRKFKNFIFLCGDTQSYGIGGTDAYLIKTDLNGKMLFGRTFGYTGNESIISLLISDNKIFMVGGTDYDGLSTTDAYIICTDLNGEKIWEKTYGDDNFDYAYDIIQNGKSYLVCGYASDKEKKSDIYLFKINHKGDLIWEKFYGGKDWDISYNIINDNDNFLLTGYTSSFGSGKTDIYILKVDSNGNCLWAKTYGGIRDDIGISALKTKDGNILIAGNSSSFTARGFGTDILLFKIDANGNSLWTKVFPASNLEVGFKLFQDKEENIYLCGTKTCYGICDKNVYVIKLNKEGNTLWYKILASKRTDTGSSLIVDDNYNIYVTGTTSFSDLKGDIFLTKLDKNGNVLW